MVEEVGTASQQERERPDYWDIDDFGMGLSCLVATTADKIDPKRKVGSCVLSEDGQVLSFGYNHMPDKDDSYSWNRETKHDYVLHAEMDTLKGITKNEISTHKATLYTTLHPCNNCARYIVLMGVRRVVYYSDWKIDKFNPREARRILSDTKFKQYGKEVGTVSVKPPFHLKCDKAFSTSVKYTNRFTEDDKFFLRVALMAAEMSPDPHTQVGACLGRVTEEGEKVIGGIGYNAMPRTGRLPWGKKAKYDYVCFAVRNAIFSRTKKDVSKFTLYTTHYPSKYCAQAIIETHIKRVVYISDKFNESKEKAELMEAAKKMFSNHNIEVDPFDGNPEDLNIVLDLDKLEKGKPT